MVRGGGHTKGKCGVWMMYVCVKVRWRVLVNMVCSAEILMVCLKWCVYVVLFYILFSVVSVCNPTHHTHAPLLCIRRPTAPTCQTALPPPPPPFASAPKSTATFFEPSLQAAFSSSRGMMYGVWFMCCVFFYTL
ncbi:hypothetical protein EON63_18365 [archaeon]|nr:MAG: hypothetical protein EON63_18365 [archaeon]